MKVCTKSVVFAWLLKVTQYWKQYTCYQIPSVRTILIKFHSLNENTACKPMSDSGIFFKSNKETVLTSIVWNTQKKR